MIEYPDRWVVLEITDIKQNTKIRKLFCIWYGGYCNSDAWRITSGNTNFGVKHNDRLEFDQESGATYSCNPESYGLSEHTLNSFMSIFEKTKESNSISIRILDKAEVMSRIK
jgi:hypothetical protein